MINHQISYDELQLGDIIEWHDVKYQTWRVIMILHKYDDLRYFKGLNLGTGRTFYLYEILFVDNMVLRSRCD